MCVCVRVCVCVCVCVWPNSFVTSLSLCLFQGDVARCCSCSKILSTGSSEFLYLKSIRILSNQCLVVAIIRYTL